MTAVKCPYCDQSVAPFAAPDDSPLPCFRDGFVGDDGRILGLRPGTHQCVGLQWARRIFAAAALDHQP